jgi:hypothetical protein
MKALKSFFALSILLVSSISFAQPTGGGQRDGQQGPPPIPNNKQITQLVSDLADNLSLSDVQEVKILELYKEHFVQMKAKTSGNSRPKREDMEALNTALVKKVKAELTKEQTGKYEAFLKKQSKQRPHRR